MLYRLNSNIPNQESVFLMFSNQYGGASYSELAIILAALRASYNVHQHHHWICFGDSFYGDHLLYQKLYESLLPKIDLIGEKCVSLGGEILVQPIVQMQQTIKLMEMVGCGCSAVPNSMQLVDKSYNSEKLLSTIIGSCMQSLEVNGLLTQGLENTLQEILDMVENNCYLLKQRLKNQ